MSTFEIVQDIIVQQLNVKCDDVKPESLLYDDLMADSLDAVEIAMELEVEFNIVLTEETVRSWITVKDIVDSVDKEIGTFWGKQRETRTGADIVGGLEIRD